MFLGVGGGVGWDGVVFLGVDGGVGWDGVVFPITDGGVFVSSFSKSGMLLDDSPITYIENQVRMSKFHPK